MKSEFWFQALVWIFFSTGYVIAEEGMEAYVNYCNEIYVEDKQAEAEMRNALILPFQHWNERTLHYKISSEYTNEEANNVRRALKVLQEGTCLMFEEHEEYEDTGSKRIVYYKKSPDMCGTKVGYQIGPATTHDVALNTVCLSKVGVIQHETLHVLGLYHEQSRTDRNKYLQVEYSNIPMKYWSQFMTYPHTTTFNVPYDYESLMHYSAYAFAKDPSKPSLRAIVNGVVVDRPMGQLKGPSEGDLVKVNKMYNCY